MITLSVLSQEERKRILEASFRILEETGVQIDHPEVFRKLGEAGCRGDEEKRRVFFPRRLVEEKVKLCPSRVRFADRKGGLFMAEPGGPSVFWTGNALNITRGKETRPIREEDFAAFCRVIDALPHIDGVVGTNLSEYPPGAKDFVGFRVMMENTGKHLRPCIYTPQGVAVIIEMAQAYLAEFGEDLRSRPIVSTGYTIVSPLHWTREGLDVYVRSAGYGMPATVNSECISGATSPVTLAGTLVLANAEALSGIVINQVLEPGRPVIYNLGFSHVMDMRTAEPTTGAPENGLLAAAGAAFARDLNLPSAAWHCSDASGVDSQSAFEHALVGLVQLLGGANIIWGAGNLEFTRAISLEQAVIDNEIIYGAQRVKRGIEVSDETLALDLIQEFQSSANYLGSDLTLKHFRRELTSFTLANRHRRSEWERRGGKSLEEAALEQVERILAKPGEDRGDGRAMEKVRAIERKWLEKVGG
jgi:trimethylamine--corrinoid protein Co-methyltransferase